MYKNSIQTSLSLAELMKIISTANTEVNEINHNLKESVNKMSQEKALAQVSRRRYIVGSINESGLFSIAATPVEHLDPKSAQIERERLATAYPGKAFVTLQFVGASRVQPSIVQTY